MDEKDDYSMCADILSRTWAMELPRGLASSETELDQKINIIDGRNNNQKNSY